VGIPEHQERKGRHIMTEQNETPDLVIDDTEGHFIRSDDTDDDAQGHFIRSDDTDDSEG
jgi:hypothetical protein